jgi:hypothetical protein
MDLIKGIILLIVGIMCVLVILAVLLCLPLLLTVFMAMFDLVK